MKKYVLNKLDTDSFDVLLTLLDYETMISDYLNTIRISSDNVNKILIDTALCSGLNQYRFIAAILMNDGTIDINNLQYVNVERHVLSVANEILQNEPLSLNNSILTKSQIDYILNFSKMCNV